MIEAASVCYAGAGFPTVEARVTAPDGGYGQGGAQQGALAAAYYLLTGQPRDLWGDSEYMSDAAALTYSAVWGCVRVITQALFSVSWNVYERRANDPRYKFPISDDVAWTLDLQANPEMTALSWREVMLKDALLSGNGYSEIELRGKGSLGWLWRIDWKRVCPDRDQSGQLWYEVENGSGVKNTALRPEKVFHLKGMGDDGLVGYSVVHMARRAIQLGLYEERFGVQTFGRGPMPGGIVSLPGSATQEKRKEFRKDFERLYAGTANAGRVVVLSDGITFTPASLPNDDQQFLESRRFQVGEICRWFGVPPHKLADLERATFSNIEEQERAFVGDTVLPWARRLESEADVKLFGTVSRGRRFTRLNLDALQRGNSQTQTDTVTKKVNAALLTVNEGREYFDLNPIEGGDTPLVQGAMVPLDDVINPPEPPEPPPAPAQNPAPGGAEPQPPPGQGQAPARPPEARRVFVALLADAYGRLLRVEADKARRAANKGRLTEHLADYYGRAEAIGHATQVLTPVFEGLLLALTGSAKGGVALAHTAACRHVERSRAELLAHGALALEGWQERAVVQAEFDEDKVERDEKGRFGTGGGGDAAGADKEGADKAAPEVPAEVQAARDKEDAALEKQHEKEDAAVDKAREKEDVALEKAREKEDSAVEKAREKEDERTEAAREKEDEKIASVREAQEEKTQAAREKEDEKRESEFDRNEERVEKQAEKEFAQREVEREKLYPGDQQPPDEVAERWAKEEQDIDEKLADEKDARAEAYDKKTEEVQAARDREDAERADREAEEDEAREKQREAEDEERAARREAEDEAREEKRAAEDRGMEGRREREDGERADRQEAERVAVIERREKEDEARAGNR